jgi:hypothetical protein
LTHSHEAALAVLTLVLAVACSEERAADSDADIIPPAAIVDLRVAMATDESIELIWSPSGDDSLTGFCPYYEIGYSVDPINESSWPTTDKVHVQILASAVTDTVTEIVSGLAPARSYYFGIKGIDDAGNHSALSNIVSAKTQTLDISADEFQFAPGTEWCYEVSVIVPDAPDLNCIDTMTISVLSVSTSALKEQVARWKVSYSRCPPRPYGNEDISTVSHFADSCTFVSDRFGDWWNPPIVRRLLFPLKSGLSWRVPYGPQGMFRDTNVVSEGGVVYLHGVGLDSVFSLKVYYRADIFNEVVSRDYWFTPDVGLVRMNAMHSVFGGYSMTEWRLIRFHSPGI